MFEERTIQWFCSEEQFEANKDSIPPQNWNIVPRDEKMWDEYSPACKTDADCPYTGAPNNQVCTKLYWDATSDGKNFANGECCYNWNEPVCPGEEFAAQNYNYDNTQFSYFWQQKCTSGESSASVLVTASAVLFAAFNLM